MKNNATIKQLALIEKLGREYKKQNLKNSYPTLTTAEVLEKLPDIITYLSAKKKPTDAPVTLEDAGEAIAWLLMEYKRNTIPMSERLMSERQASTLVSLADEFQGDCEMFYEKYHGELDDLAYYVKSLRLNDRVSMKSASDMIGKFMKARIKTNYYDPDLLDGRNYPHVSEDSDAPMEEW